MVHRRSIGAVGVAMALLCGATARPAFAAVAVANTSTYAGSGRWNWTIFIDADAATLRQIKCVEYTLHPTFPNPVRTVCDQPGMKFALSSNGWGTFTVGVKIQYKNGRTEETRHALVLQEQKTSLTSLNVMPKNRSREIEPGWWEWSMFIDGAKSELDRIRCVEYTLHPTFPNPVRVVCTRQNGFDLTARGWGTFAVGVKLMLKDGSTQSMSHQLEFR